MVKEGDERMKKIIFQYKYGIDDHEVYEEEKEFSDRATEEGINETYVEWVFEQISDKCTWYVKED